MRAALVLAFYLSDQLLSVLLPFSSGPFAIAMIAICMHRVAFDWGVLAGILIVSAVVFGTGFAGALLTRTPISAFFVATIAMVTALWIVGAGLRRGNSVLVTPNSAFAGVLASSGFLLLSLLGWDAFSTLQGTSTNRNSGLYLEPSHYALFVMPLWLIAYQHRPHRPWLYAALVFAFAVCFSATLAALLLCAFGVRVYLSTSIANFSLYKLGRQFIKVSVLALLAYSMSSFILVADEPLQDYVGSRLYGLTNSYDTGNLSSMVVLQGIELSQISFSQSLGMGVGLGNFGTSVQILNQSVHRATINTIMNGSDLNLRDGGLLASKLVGELGVLSFVVLLLLALYFHRLKAIPEGGQRNYHGALAVALLCLVFVRALPYFSAPVCLVIFSLATVLTPARFGRPVAH